MIENLNGMSLHEWKQQQKYKEEYRKILAAEDKMIREQMLGLTPIKKKRKKNEQA
jgi:hypothetical protein